MESLVDLQQGRPEAAQAILEHARARPTTTTAVSSDSPTAAPRSGSRCSSSARSTTRSTCSRAATRTSTEDGPAMVDRLPARARVRGRAARRRRRRRDRRDASAARAARSPTACSRCGPRASCARSRARPTRAAPIDAAYEIATATDAPLEHAIAALARAKVLAALGADDADAAADEADRQLDAARPHRRRLGARLRPRARRRHGSLVTYRRGAELIEHDVAGVAVGERRHAGRDLAAGHDVAHDLGEAAHRIVVAVGAARSARASGVRSSRVPSARRTIDPVVGEDLAHRVGAEHGEAGRHRRARREACCRSPPSRRVSSRASR